MIDNLQARYVAQKKSQPGTVYVTVCVIWDLQRFRQLMHEAFHNPEEGPIKDFLTGDHMTVHEDYPLDPLQNRLVESTDFSRDANRLRRLLFEEFCTQFAELENGSARPQGIAVIRTEDMEGQTFRVIVLSDAFFPYRVS